jgi:hypothetical protein
MTLRLVFAALAGEYARETAKIELPVARGVTAAMREAQTIGRQEIRAAIGAAGFSRRWQNIVRSAVVPKQGDAIDASVSFFDKSFFVNLFEKGETHVGKPFMWLPLDTVPLGGTGSTRLTPKQYRERLGKLFSVRNASGVPILVGKATSGVVLRASAKSVRFRKRKGRSISGAFNAPNVPLFVGISTVNIRSKFNISAIIQRLYGRIGELYAKNFRPEI